MRSVSPSEETVITYVNGDLFTSPAAVLVNTVNTVGVMGKGIAKEFKRIFPEMFTLYQERCERGEIQIGTLFLYRSKHKSVLNFPTKEDWRKPSHISFVEQGLKTFVNSYEHYGIDSIAFPQLGCGNGELDWESQVRPLMERYLQDLPIRVYLHVSNEQAMLPEHHDKAWMKRWLNSEPESLPVTEVWRDLVYLVNSTSGMNGWDLSVVKIQVLSLVEGGEVESSTEAIQFARASDVLSITQEDFLPIWRRLKTHGLASDEDFPSSLRAQSAPLMDLLLRLEYLEPVRYRPERDRKAADAEFVSGVKLVPRATADQKALVLI